MKSSTVIAGLATSALALSFAVPAHADQGVESEYAAIASVAPEVLEGNAGRVADGEVALVGTDGAESIAVAADPQDGIHVPIGDEFFTIGIPNDQSASDAAEISDNLVSFDGNDGSVTVPIVKGEGELQILTVIEKSEASTQYEYELDLPDGVHLEMVVDGRVILVNTADDIVVGWFAKPWARDAEGVEVATHFTVEQNRLIQTVQHVGASYPVVADPWWIPAIKAVARWTTHALQQQAARNISDAAIKAALQEGRRTAGNQAGTSVFTNNGIRVVVNNRTGAIISVTRTSGGGGV